jgi:hypothetical protein
VVQHRDLSYVQIFSERAWRKFDFWYFVEEEEEEYDRRNKA